LRLKLCVLCGKKKSLTAKDAKRIAKDAKRIAKDAKVRFSKIKETGVSRKDAKAAKKIQADPASREICAARRRMRVTR
jgi:hypothetical protein